MKILDFLYNVFYYGAYIVIGIGITCMFLESMRDFFQMYNNDTEDIEEVSEKSEKTENK